MQGGGGGAGQWVGEGSQRPGQAEGLGGEGRAVRGLEVLQVFLGLGGGAGGRSQHRATPTGPRPPTPEPRPQPRPHSPGTEPAAGAGRGSAPHLGGVGPRSGVGPHPQPHPAPDWFICLRSPSQLVPPTLPSHWLLPAPPQPRPGPTRAPPRLHGKGGLRSPAKASSCSRHQRSSGGLRRRTEPGGTQGRLGGQGREMGGAGIPKWGMGPQNEGWDPKLGPGVTHSPPRGSRPRATPAPPAAPRQP